MMRKPDNIILTAGPSITSKEISYVTDAVENGWNEQWNKYILAFEKAFAAYLGVRHALSTSSCTGALHLALCALGIKENDEVIIPDLTWVATASVIRYLNAQPVMVDVKRDTWTIDPDSIKKNITPKTKAIIPVHLYGNPSAMDEIMSIARDNHLLVIEDAAPSLGAKIRGQKVGTSSDMAAFSFQGAKLMTCGEGGMLVTNSEELFKKAKHLSEHGKVSAGFEVTDIGYKYKMSNIQAALGLAQLERIEELINKKIAVYRWYRERLNSINDISLSKDNSKEYGSVYWMTSIVLNNDSRITRDELMHKLKSGGIDTRPFFPLVSSFKMFKKFNNPVAQHLAKNGVNLPSGFNRTEEEIDYICLQVKKILGL